MHKSIHKKLIIKSVTDLNDDTNEEIHSEHCGSIPTAFWEAPNKIILQYWT